MAEARRLCHYETPTRADLKYAVDFALPEPAARAALEAAAAAVGTTLDEQCGRWFVDEAGVRAPHDRGHTVGVQGISHRPLADLGRAGRIGEIADCRGWLADLLGVSPTWWACPFGGGGSPELPAVDAAAAAMGLTRSVGTGKRPVPPGSTRDMPRSDRFDLPPIVAA